MHDCGDPKIFSIFGESVAQFVAFYKCRARSHARKADESSSSDEEDGFEGVSSSSKKSSSSTRSSSSTKSNSSSSAGTVQLKYKQQQVVDARRT